MEHIFETCEYEGKLAVQDQYSVIFSEDKTTLLRAPKEIEEYVIPDSVTTIGKSAFYCCHSLISITIPNSVTTIGGFAFQGCTSLKSVTIPNSVTKIGDGAFYYCKSLISITISNNVTEIGRGALWGCIGLTSITIPDSVIKVGTSTFRDCTGLTSLTIPDSVTEIGAGAFEGCTGLTHITIPDSVTEIGQDAFKGCTSLKSIIIPDSVTKIGKAAFDGCIGLTNILIPDSVIEIGNEAFKDCTKLSSINISQNVIEIGSNAFDGWTGVINITISDNGTEIKNRVFQGWTKPINISIPNGITEIRSEAFRGCTGLTNISIPDSVTEIGNEAFKGCLRLKKITIPDSVVKVGMRVFDDCLELNEPIHNRQLFLFLPTNFEGAYTIPDGVTRIGHTAFAGCTGLTSITIPDTITEVGASAFKGCTKLRTPIHSKYLFVYIPQDYQGHYIIPDGIKTIASYAFCDCSELISITIPLTVTAIGKSAVEGCTKLSQLILKNPIPPKISELGISPSTPIVVPAESLEAYQQAEGWKNYTIKPYQYYQYGNAKYLPKEGSLYGELALLIRKDKENYTIHPDTRIISESVFEGCTEMLRVVIPNQVTHIHERAFAECINLRDVVLGEKVEYITREAFVGCENIQSLTIYACEPPIVEENALSGWDFEIPVIVPQGSLQKYQADAVWCQFPKLIEKQAEQIEKTIENKIETTSFHTQIEHTAQERKSQPTQAYFVEEPKKYVKKYLFFDTETTGLPLNWRAPVTRLNNWPRLVQLAWLLCDEDGKQLSEGNVIIYPDGFTIPVDASKVHGITTEKARREGKQLLPILRQFADLVSQADYLVAHNMSFDEKIMGAELLRANMTNVVDNKKKICTMMSSMDYCAIPGRYDEYKWPKLQELHKKLFGSEFEEAHDAYADIKATAKCFWELKNRGIINI